MKLQKSIAGKTTGSFINYMMGNNTSLPEVGKGATVLMWTDRHAYEVLNVSEDSKRVVIQQYLPTRSDNNGMSETQNYEYKELNGQDEVIVWKWGAWRRESKIIEFTEDYAKTIGNDFYKSEDYKLLYPEDNDSYCPVLIEGKTIQKTVYSKVNILWGVKEEYYDYSF